MIPSPDPAGNLRPLAVRLSEAEAQAAALEQWLDAAFATSAVAMSVVSCHELRCLRVNAAMAELYGMTVDEVLRSDPFTLALAITHPDDLVAEQKLFSELVTGARRSYRFVKRYLRADGSIRWGDLTFTVIHDASLDPATPVGPIRIAVLQVVDVTDRKLLEEAARRRDEELRHAQKIDGIGRLAAGVAHDFNNMLTVITGHGELLKRRIRSISWPAGPDLMADLDAILSASERAASLTAQLLAYGRREAAAPAVLVLSDAVAASQRLLGRTLESSIEVEPSLTATGSVLADRGHIGQVVMNLVLNARDALSGGGRIALSTRDVVVSGDAEGGPPPGRGEWVALSVADSGHGMSPAVRARMFEPFFTTRADRPGTQGTGLGLATVQRIVAESGGRIDVRSAPGEGTTVTVYFPRVSAAPGEALAPRAPPVAQAALNSQRVLVVEDEPSVRSLVATVLLGGHYRVVVARSGEEALRLVEAEREPFDLVVTDLVMAGVGGLELARRIQEMAIPTRVLFISGYSRDTPADLAPHGALLGKPFTPAQLLAAVGEALAPG